MPRSPTLNQQVAGPYFRHFHELRSVTQCLVMPTCDEFTLADEVLQANFEVEVAFSRKHSEQRDAPSFVVDLCSEALPVMADRGYLAPARRWHSERIGSIIAVVSGGRSADGRVGLTREPTSASYPQPRCPHSGPGHGRLGRASDRTRSRLASHTVVDLPRHVIPDADLAPWPTLQPSRLPRRVKQCRTRAWRLARQADSPVEPVSHMAPALLRAVVRRSEWPRAKTRPRLAGQRA
jgi:hypothetical protein